MGGVDFNFKFASWLNSQTEFLNQKHQEELFDITETINQIGELPEEQKDVIKKVSSEFLKLSFIINNNPSRTEKLIQYLQKWKIIKK